MKYYTAMKKGYMQADILLNKLEEEYTLCASIYMKRETQSSTSRGRLVITWGKGASVTRGRHKGHIRYRKFCILSSGFMGEPRVHAYSQGSLG